MNIHGAGNAAGWRGTGLKQPLQGGPSTEEGGGGCSQHAGHGGRAVQAERGCEQNQGGCARGHSDGFLVSRKRGVTDENLGEAKALSGSFCIATQGTDVDSVGCDSHAGFADLKGHVLYPHGTTKPQHQHRASSWNVH